MPSFDKKFIGGTRYHASGSTTYVSPTGQEVVSTPSSTSSVPVDTVYSKTGTPTYYTGGPCGNQPCGTPSSSSPSSSSPSSSSFLGLTTNDWIYIGIGIVLIGILLFFLMVI